MQKIGLVMGPGAAKGLAHIGVMKVLLKNKIPIDIIAGISMGAIVGGFYASGMDIDEIEKVALETNFKNLVNKVSLNRVVKESILKGVKVRHFIDSNLKVKKIENFRIPFGCCAANLANGDEVVFTKGDAALAIDASSTLPGLFKPIEYKGMFLVDGGLVNPLPIDLAKKLGAEKIICVDVLSKFSIDSDKPNLLNSALNTINAFEKRLAMLSIEKYGTEVVIQPNLKGFRAYSFNKAKEIIAVGQREAEKQIEDIKKIIFN